MKEPRGKMWGVWIFAGLIVLLGVLAFLVSFMEG